MCYFRIRIFLARHVVDKSRSNQPPWQRTYYRPTGAEKSGGNPGSSRDCRDGPPMALRNLRNPSRNSNYQNPYVSNRFLFGAIWHPVALPFGMSWQTHSLRYHTKISWSRSTYSSIVCVSISRPTIRVSSPLRMSSVRYGLSNSRCRLEAEREFAERTDPRAMASPGTAPPSKESTC